MTTLRSFVSSSKVDRRMRLLFITLKSHISKASVCECACGCTKSELKSRTTVVSQPSAPARFLLWAGSATTKMQIPSDRRYRSRRLSHLYQQLVFRDGYR